MTFEARPTGPDIKKIEACRSQLQPKPSNSIGKDKDKGKGSQRKAIPQALEEDLGLLHAAFEASVIASTG